jgi:hypothetical protein
MMEVEFVVGWNRQVSGRAYGREGGTPPPDDIRAANSRAYGERAIAPRIGRTISGGVCQRE